MIDWFKDFYRRFRCLSVFQMIAVFIGFFVFVMLAGFVIVLMVSVPIFGFFMGLMAAGLYGFASLLEIG